MKNKHLFLYLIFTALLVLIILLMPIVYSLTADLDLLGGYTTPSNDEANLNLGDTADSDPCDPPSTGTWEVPGGCEILQSEFTTVKERGDEVILLVYDGTIIILQGWKWEL